MRKGELKNYNSKSSASKKEKTGGKPVADAPRIAVSGEHVK